MNYVRALIKMTRIFLLVQFCAYFSSAQEILLLPQNNGYVPMVSGLPTLESIDPTGEIAPYYTGFLVLSNGHYAIYDSLFNNEFSLPLQSLGIEFGQQPAISSYLLFSGRYNDPQPPEKSTQSTLLDPVLNSTSDFGTFENKVQRVNQVFLESNHDVLAGRTNGYAVSYRPVNQSKLYIFYNRKIDNDVAQEVNNFEYSMSDSPPLPYYAETGSVTMPPVEGNPTYSAFKHGGEFNSLILYEPKREFEFTRKKIDSRFFFNLSNTDLSGNGAQYEILAVLTHPSEGTTLGFDDTTPGFELLSEITNGNFEIDHDKIVGFYLLSQETLLPHDPNSLELIDMCRCQEKIDSNRVQKRFYQFKFCNDGKGKKIGEATEATITIDNQWFHFQDCFTYESSTPVEATTQNDGSFFMKGMRLQDLRLSQDPDSSCAEIIFSGYTRPGSSLTLPSAIAACATFVIGDSTVCAMDVSEAGGAPCKAPCTFCNPAPKPPKWIFGVAALAILALVLVRLKKK